MEEKFILRRKSFDFSIRIVNLYRYLCDEKKEFVLSKQLLRSGTAIGALIREGEYAESKLDFIHKYAVAQKEYNESLYWLELMNKTEIVSLREFESLFADANELMKIITASIITAKKSLNKNSTEK